MQQYFRYVLVRHLYDIMGRHHDNVRLGASENIGDKSDRADAHPFEKCSSAVLNDDSRHNTAPPGLSLPVCMPRFRDGYYPAGDKDSAEAVALEPSGMLLKVTRIGNVP
jgi:hypothetical protein